MNNFKRHPKLRSLTGILSANVFNNLASFIVTMFAARLFGPAEFAKFALATAITTNLSSILDFGTNVALVRLYNVETNNVYKSALIRVIHKWNIGLLLLVFLLCYPLGLLLIKFFPIFKNTGLLIYLAIISSSLLNIWGSTRAIEQSQKKFKSIQKYTLIYGFLRLTILMLFVLSHQTSITTIYISLYIAPLSILIGCGTIVNYISHEHKSDKNLDEVNEFKVLHSILSYGFWIGIAGILFTIMYQIPQFVLARYASANEVGFYAAGFTFLPIFLLTNDAVRTMILPDISAMQNTKDRQEFRRRLGRVSHIFFSCMIIVLFSISLIQYYLLGHSYRASVPIFLALGGSTILVMFLGYSNTLIHSLGIPYVMTIINMFRVLMLFLLTLLIPKTAFFMSLSVGVVSIFGEILIYLIVQKFEKRSLAE